MIKIKKSLLLKIFLYSVSTLIFLSKPYTENFNKIVAVGVLVLSIAVVYRCRKNNLLFILSLFISYVNYSIVVGIYLFPDLRPKYLYPQITDVEVYGIGIAMIYLFLLALLCFFPNRINKDDSVFASDFIKKENYNPWIFGGSLLLFSVILLLGYERVPSGRGISSPIYEYNVIFLILMFYYSGNLKINKYICYLSALAYAMTSMSNGTRIEALVCLLVVFFCGINKEVPKKTLTVGLFAGIVLFNLIGNTRGNSVSLSEGLLNSISDLLQEKLVFDTATHAYFPALGMIEQFKYFSLDTSFHFLGRFLGTIVAGQSRVKDGNLISYVSNFYYHNFGGLTTGFFYVWFSYLGSLIFGYIVGWYVRFINNNSKRSAINLCAGLYAVCSVPRWYLYGPWSLFRGVLLCVIVFCIVQYMDKEMRRRHNRYLIK